MAARALPIYFTKEELRLVLRLTAGEYVQKTERSMQLREGVRGKIEEALGSVIPDGAFEAGGGT